MKALISPNEVSDYSWVISWKKEGDYWVPDETGLLLECQRVAEVEPDNKVFEVAQPLFWVDCPDDCEANTWYYKDGQLQPKPQSVLPPE